MKPVYSVLIRRGDAEHVLNFPLNLRRINKTLATLGYGPNFNGIDDGHVVEYFSRIGAPPCPDSQFEDVDNIAKILAQFTPEQIRALRHLCAAFDLSFLHVNGFINFICHAKDTTWGYIALNGVPGQNGNIDGAGWKYGG